MTIIANGRGDNAIRCRDVPIDRPPKLRADAAGRPIARLPKPSDCRSSSRSRRSTHIQALARTPRRQRHKAAVERVRYRRPHIRRHRPPTRPSPKVQPKESQISSQSSPTALDERNAAVGYDSEKSITLQPIHLSVSFEVATEWRPERPDCRPLAPPSRRRIRKRWRCCR